VPLVLPLALVACRLPAPEARPPLVLVESGSAQSFFDAEGRLLRVLVDADQDRRADVQFLYRPDGTVRVAEVDADRDGVVDRWEHYGADGSLERVGRSQGSRGRPDVWEGPDLSGGEQVQLEELDTDGDGKPDRRLHRRSDGAVIALEIDSDGDGVWERRAPVRPR
jgi:hypothetical protein